MPRRGLIERAVAVVFIAVVSLVVMGPVRLNGDEGSYASGAEAIGLWVRDLLGGAPYDASVIDGVRQNGWFMPGVSVVLAPLYVALGADVPVVAIRVWMLVLNLACVWFLAAQVESRWGRRAHTMLLVVLALSPNYVFFVSTAWSDLLSLHLALLMLFWILDRFPLEGDGPTWKDGVIAGLMIAGLAYLRMLYPVYLAVIGAALLLRLVSKAITRRRLIRLGTPILLAGTIVVALIAPWVGVVSAEYGAGWSPLTSRPLGQIVWKGDPEVIDEARQSTGIGSVFHALNEAVWQRAHAEGISYRAAAKQLQEDAAVDRSTPETMRLYRENVHHFLGDRDVNAFVARFLRLRCGSDAGCLPGWFDDGLRWWSNASWRLTLVAGAVIFAVPYRLRRSRDLYMTLIWKASVFSLAIFPFVRIAHGRYLVGLIPMFALGFAAVSAGAVSVMRPGDVLAAPRTRSAFNAAGQLLAIGLVVATAYFALS